MSLPNSIPTLRVHQRNWRGFGRQKQEKFVRDISNSSTPPDVVMIIDSHLSDREASKHIVDGYSMYHRERPNQSARGGVGLLIRNHPAISHRLAWSSPESATQVESIAVDVVTANGTVTFTAAYAPHALAISADVLAQSFLPALTDPETQHVIGADLNSHHSLWEASYKHARPGINDETPGEKVLEWIGSLGMEIANDATVTTRQEVHLKDNQRQVLKTSPDLTLGRGPTISNWTATHSAESDHAAITYEVGDGNTIGAAPKHAFWNYDKANWEKFSKEVDGQLERISGTVPVERMETLIREAANKHIPRGFRAKRVPLWSREMEVAEEAWQSAAKLLSESTSPTEIEQRRAAELAARQNKAEVFMKERSRLFKEKLSEMEDADRVWQLVKNVGKKSNFSGSVLKTENGTVLDTRKKQAQAFVKQYAEVATRSSDTSKPPKIGVGQEVYHEFTWAEWKRALRKTKARKAPGPDEVSADMLKRLSNAAQHRVLDTINSSFRSGDVPESWRTGIIIPLLKPGKNPEELKSYRPVTLTSHMCKLTERMISHRVIYALGDRLQGTQFGFRHGRSTIDAVARLVDFVIEAINEYHLKGYYAMPNRAASILVDFSSAFDTIDHDMVIKRLLRMGVPAYEVRWIRNFLCNRRNYVRVDSVDSRKCAFTAGVPQGTVLGPLLFIVAMDSLLEKLASIPGLHTVAFADDLTVSAKGNDGKSTEPILQQAMDTIAEWCSMSKMKVNVGKTKGLVFTKSALVSHESTPTVTYTPPGGQTKTIEVGLELKDGDAPGKLLGMCLDKRLHFSEHVRYAKAKTTTALAQLQVIAHSKTGLSRNSIRKFAKGYAAAKLTYGIDIIYHLMNDATKLQLDRSHRTIMRRQLGLLDRTESTGTYLEANEMSLNLEMDRRAINWIERLREQGGDQQSFAERPPPTPPKLRRYGHDVAEEAITSATLNARSLSSVVLEWAGIDPNQPRLLKASMQAIPPWEADIPPNVTIVESIGLKKSSLSTEEQHEASKKAIEGHGKADVAIWTDGSAHFNRVTEGPGLAKSGGAAVIVMQSAFGECVASMTQVPAGVGACSKTAEEQALLAGLVKANWGDHKGGLLLIATDSQSLLSDLSKGPLECSSVRTQVIWRCVKDLASRFDKVVFQHVFSHCGLKYNELADKQADLACNRDQSVVEVKASDIKAMAKAYIKEVWQEELEVLKDASHRAKTWGLKPPPKAEAEWPRRLQVAASMLRTNAFPNIGPLTRMIYPTMPTGCRFCVTTTKDASETNETTNTEAGNPDYAAAKATERVLCPECGQTCAERVVLKRHVRNKHPGVTLSFDRFKCGIKECTQRFATKKECDAHRRQAHPGEKVEPPKREESTTPDETIPHLLICPALQQARTKWDVPDFTGLEEGKSEWKEKVESNMKQVCEFLSSLGR